MKWNNGRMKMQRGSQRKGLLKHVCLTANGKHSRMSRLTAGNIGILSHKGQRQGSTYHTTRVLSLLTQGFFLMHCSSSRKRRQTGETASETSSPQGRDTVWGSPFSESTNIRPLMMQIWLVLIVPWMRIILSEPYKWHTWRKVHRHTNYTN